MPRIEEFDRDQVLQKAMNVFWEKGYNGASMQDLVDATTLNRSSIYNSFGSKLELYQATLRHYQKNGNAYFQKALLKAKSPLEAIQFIFEGFIPEIIHNEKENGCFVNNCKSEMVNQDEDVRKWLLNTQEHTLSIFRGLIEDGQEQGTINRNQNVESYTYYVFNAFQGFRMTGILVKDGKILRQLVDSIIKVLK